MYRYDEIEQDDDLDAEDFDESAEEQELEDETEAEEAIEFANKVRTLFGVDKIRYGKSKEVYLKNKHGKVVRRTVEGEEVISPEELYVRLIYTPSAYSRIKDSALVKNMMFAVLCVNVNCNVYSCLPRQLQEDANILSLTELKIDKHMGDMPTKDFGRLTPELVCMKLKIKHFSEKTPDIVNEISDILAHKRTQITMVDFVRELVAVNPYVYQYIYSARENVKIAKTTAKVKHQINVNEQTRKAINEVINDKAILKFLNCLPLHGGGNPMHGINPFRIYDKQDYNPAFNVLRYRYEQDVFTETEMLNMSEEEYAEVQSRADKYFANYSNSKEK